jgi:hypothetical protein
MAAARVPARGRYSTLRGMCPDGASCRHLRMDKAGSDGVLVVTKLDRLARSTLDFASIVRRAERKGWQLVVLDLGLDMTTPMGRFAANVAAAVAELERELIADRTRDGLAVVKARGTTKTGKPAVFGHPSRVPTDVRARIVRERDEGGTSWRAIADALNRDGIASPGASSPAGHNRTDTRWHANAARRIYDLTATKVAQGNIRTQTMRAFGENEMSRIISG